MKILKISLLALLVLFLTGIIACQNQQQKTEDLSNFNRLSWLENVWRGKQGEAKIYESWHKKNFWLMEGISYTTDETGKRVFSQDMRIEQDNNHIYYIIKLPGNNRQTFDLVSITDTSVVFKNEDNQYPQTIKYRHPANDSLVVLLKGKNEGNEMNTKLNYEKS